ncbi:MAG: ATP-binding protein [Deltaproteobacteria bacterium]|nr:ATP-binding protein [Deltaproteobacteria bacterium]
MTQELPVLPLGMADFDTLREKQAVYVDKTKYITDLEKAGQFVFCARPRRFGKSLTVDTLDAFYSGRKDLFQGLAAEKVMCSPNFTVCPVIRLDMSAVAGSDSAKLLQNSIMMRLEIIAERHQVSLRGDNCAVAFSCLIQDVHKASGKKAVLLLDEYDAPVTDLIGRDKYTYDPKLLSETRNIIQKFYTQIKVEGKLIKLAFITGVTKFSRMGVFSKLNNLRDISLLSGFSAFMGCTHEELMTYFAHFISATALELKMSEEGLLNKTKDYYYGFSFDGKTKVYNPFSVISFFAEKEFGNFWMESGSNTVVRKFLWDKELTVDQFQGQEMDYSEARQPGEIDATSPEGFLYQSGYLTLRAKDGGRYLLDYPNSEVRQAFSKLFLQNFNSDWGAIGKSGRELGDRLASGDIIGIVTVLIQLLAGIHYRDHSDANTVPLVRMLKKTMRKKPGGARLEPSDEIKAATLADKLQKERGESYYRSLLQACLWMAGAKTTPEKPENCGRLDLEVVYGSMTYVMELKISKNAKGAARAARSGMNQIHLRGYGGASETPVLVSLAVGKEERNIVGGLFKRNGRETALRIKNGTCVTPPPPPGDGSG